MNVLAKFLGGITKLQVFRVRKIEKLGESRVNILCEAYQADKKCTVDGQKIDLKEFAGLGTEFGAIGGGESKPGFICDYFVPLDDAMCVVEHSQMLRQMKNLKEERGVSLMRETIKREYRLKAYGSMLVLCRLFLRHSVVNQQRAKEFTEMPCKFWVVVTDALEDEQIRAFQFLSDSLKDGLDGLYSSGVAILTVDMFKEELRKLPRS